MRLTLAVFLFWQAVHPTRGAGNGARTRDIKLGKLALYQLSYARPAALETS